MSDCLGCGPDVVLGELLATFCAGILVSIADLLARMQPSLIVQEQKLSK